MPWFMERLRHGWVGVRAPFGGKEFEISLRASDVIAILFWTKNAAPIIPFIRDLEDNEYDFLIHYTVNGYPPEFEPGVPPPAHAIDTIRRVHEFRPGLLTWRYDTIVLTEYTDPSFHVTNFSRICEKISPYVDTCVFSFCDYYRKTRRNMREKGISFHEPPETQARELAEMLAEIAAVHGVQFASCAHDFLLSDRIAKARCVDPELLFRSVRRPEGRAAIAALKRSPTRKGCGCVESRDIGAYDTCLHGCVYCYANSSPRAAKAAVERLNPGSVSLYPAYRGSDATSGKES
jgi:hypothetical protein